MFEGEEDTAKLNRPLGGFRGGLYIITPEGNKMSK
jgi:hypothetical protein